MIKRRVTTAAVASVLTLSGCGLVPNYDAWLSTCSIGVDTLTAQMMVAQSAIEQGLPDEAAYAIDQGNIFFNMGCLPAPTPELTRVITDIVNSQDAAADAMRAGDAVDAAHHAAASADGLQRMRDMVGSL